ncbi:hypothetical protein ACFL9T_20570 [Thermodesulfobacteriota bacterium]
MAPEILQEPDEFCIRFRIEPVFYQSNLEPLAQTWLSSPVA